MNGITDHGFIMGCSAIGAGLAMIAGIGPSTSGRILMDGKDITDVDPAKRDIAMVFQNYAIYPTMSVRENIEFGLKNRKVPRAERARLIEEYSAIVNDVQTYVNEARGKFITGEWDVEAKWDEYCKTIEGMKLSRAIEIKQAAVDRYNAR